MKKPMHFLYTWLLLAPIFMLFSCNKDKIDPQPTTPVSLTQEKADEISLAFLKSKANARVAASSDSVFYDFAATFTTGQDNGKVLAGKLSLAITKYQFSPSSSYDVLTGTLKIAGSSTLFARGVKFGSSVFVFFYNDAGTPQSTLIVGSGTADSGGVIQGRFARYVPVPGSGLWVAKPSGALKSIVEIAVGDARFSTLVSALKATNLVGALSGAGPFTVFAPTNDAFAKLSKLPEGDALKEVLLYHVASGKLTAANLVKTTSITTLQGGKVSVHVNAKGELILNGNVKVIIKDIQASNGIIHAIDAVLIPKKAV